MYNYVIVSSGKYVQCYLQTFFFASSRCWHRRTGQHPLGGGGQTEFCPNGFGGRGGGGGGSRRNLNYPGSIFSGGGGSSRNFRRPIRWGAGVVAELFPLTAVTDPKFVLFKHVLCFARIMSTLCPNVCRQTAELHGGGPPVPYAYGCWRTQI